MFLRLFFLTIIFISKSALAASISLDLGEGSEVTSRVLQLIAAITILSVAPSILIMVTSFTRIAVVLSILRNALVLQQSPPNSVLISLSLFLTLFIMSPTFEQAYENGIAPLLDEKIDEKQAIERIIIPFKTFMKQHVRRDDLGLFMNIAGVELQRIKSNDMPLKVLIPAFMISELKRAFEIGFLIFLPFIIIDIFISSILMAMGMMMLPPVMVSMPFKIIFFVIIDGWHMICGSLVKSYGF